MHSVGPGAADRSYGIHVGKLAGLPACLVARAQAVLADLEAGKGPAATLGDELPLFAVQSVPARLPVVAESPALARLRALDVDSLSPRAALEALYALKDLGAADPSHG